MAKISEAPIGSTDISEFLATQDDFALELFVYHEAQNLGLDVSHGGTYEDPLTHKSRQYDLRASRICGDNRIDLAIECKSLRQSFPLLISRMRLLEGGLSPNRLFLRRRQRSTDHHRSSGPQRTIRQLGRC